MPDAYLHIRTARKTLDLSGCYLPNMAAFEMGSNGPDIFYAYKSIYKNITPNLPSLASVMHDELVSEFLMALIRNAKNNVQRSYICGFVLHNTLDSIAHPYIDFVTTEKSSPYSCNCGHILYEAAVDTHYYNIDQEGQNNVIPITEVCPVLTPGELGEITALLKVCVNQVFEQSISFLAISDSFRWFYRAHTFCTSRFGAKKILSIILERMMGKPLYISGHTQPRKMNKHVPLVWRNNFTSILYDGGLDTLVASAEKTGSARLIAICNYWDGTIDEEKLAVHLGSANYNTGLNS